MHDSSTDNYLVISRNSQGEYKDKGSKFLAYAFRVESAEDIDAHLDALRKEHFKARHHCYAWRLGVDGEPFRINDDGEPSGTAGKPIYGQLLSHNISDILIVVVRYFGGTKLGTSGLIAAYKAAAIEAIQQTKIITRVLRSKIKISFDYAEMGQVLNVTKELELNILEKVFEAKAFIIVAIRQSEVESTLVRMKAKLLNRSIEEITEETEIPFCTFTEIN